MKWEDPSILQRCQWHRISRCSKKCTWWDSCTTSRRCSAHAVISQIILETCFSSRPEEINSKKIESTKTNSCGTDCWSKKISWLHIIVKERSIRVKSWIQNNNRVLSKTCKRYLIQNENKMSNRYRANWICWDRRIFLSARIYFYQSR